MCYGMHVAILNYDRIYQQEWTAEIQFAFFVALAICHVIRRRLSGVFVPQIMATRMSQL